MAKRWMIPTGFVVAFLGASTVANGQASSPSFDCSKASGEVENKICADEGLASLSTGTVPSSLARRGNQEGIA